MLSSSSSLVSSSSRAGRGGEGREGGEGRGGGREGGEGRGGEGRGGEGRGGEGRGGEGMCGTPRLHNVIIALELVKELENMKYPPPASPLGGTKFLPHWPKVLLPKVKMVPCWVRTQVWERPMATWLTGTPSRAVTTPGEEGKRRGDSGIVLQIQSHIQLTTVEPLLKDTPETRTFVK